MKVSAASFNQNIDIIEYNEQTNNDDVKQTNNDDVIIYINGGGFSLIDSADLLLSQHLLPLLSSSTSIYSINYNTFPSYDSNGELLSNYHIVKRQIIEGYNSIINSRKNVVAIVGDSAGGNLVLQLISQLNNDGHHPISKVLLISPWLNLYSNAESFNKFEHDDFLDNTWLQKSRKFYLGKELDSYATDWMKKREADQLGPTH